MDTEENHLRLADSFALPTLRYIRNYTLSNYIGEYEVQSRIALFSDVRHILRCTFWIEHKFLQLGETVCILLHYTEDANDDYTYVIERVACMNKEKNERVCDPTEISSYLQLADAFQDEFRFHPEAIDQSCSLEEFVEAERALSILSRSGSQLG